MSLSNPCIPRLFTLLWLTTLSMGQIAFHCNQLRYFLNSDQFEANISYPLHSVKVHT